MKKVKSVAIYKPTETAVFEVGSLLMRGEEKTTIKVERISLGFLRKVKIELSDGNIIVFSGFPISYEI